MINSRMIWLGHVAWMGGRGAYMVLVVKPEGRRPLERPRHTWEDINPLNAELNPICHLLALLGTHHILHVSRIRVKLDLLEIGWVGGMDWIYLAEDKDMW
jgi:hypothetical protein